MYLASTVTGEVVDAQTGEFLSGVEVNVEETGASATTNASGAFTIDDAPAGAWTLRATQVGYVPATVPVTLTPDEATEVSIGLLRIGAGGDGVAVVLSWGNEPADLDLHVSGPDGSGGRFHIAYYALNPVAHASLDLDDLVSFGPETVTISPTQTGTYVAGDYHVWIHNFSGQPGFDVSDGIVTIFAGGAQFAQYQVGDASGDSALDIWRVIEFSIAEDGAMSNINALESFEAGTDQSVY